MEQILVPMSTPGNRSARGGLGSGRLDVSRSRSDIFAGLLYLISALGLALYYHFLIRQLFPIWSDDLYIFALLLGAALFAVASFRAFTTRKYSDLVAFAGALLAWRFFVLVEFSQYSYPAFFNAWILLNGTGPHEVAYAGLKVFAIVALTAATLHSLLRMTPEGWHFRNQTWPTFVVSFMLVATWYLAAVTPYRIPVFDIHQIPPIVIVLHVEKHGLRFHETSLNIYRGGDFLLTEDDRRLFAYGFTRNLTRGYLGDGGIEWSNKIKDSQAQLRGASFGLYESPKNWTADRWYVFVRPWGGRPLNIALSVTPGEIPALLELAKTVPKGMSWSDSRRDVCLGFCYDPTY